VGEGKRGHAVVEWVCRCPRDSQPAFHILQPGEDVGVVAARMIHGKSQPIDHPLHAAQVSGIEVVSAGGDRATQRGRDVGNVSMPGAIVEADTEIISRRAATAAPSATPSTTASLRGPSEIVSEAQTEVMSEAICRSYAMKVEDVAWQVR